jgi:hypothetical protein
MIEILVNLGLMNNTRGRVLPYLLLWMLGVPASLLIMLFLLGVGR